MRVSRAETLSNGLIMLDESLGRETMMKVDSALGVPRSSLIPAVVNSLAPRSTLGEAGHAQAPLWPVLPKYRVRVSAGVYFKKGSKRRPHKLLGSNLGFGDRNRGAFLLPFRRSTAYRADLSYVPGK